MFRLARPKALDQGDCAGVGLVALESRNLRQKAGNDALDDLQHRREQLRPGGEQDAQWNREGEHPLPYRHVRDEVAGPSHT